MSNAKEISELLTRFERQAQRFGELWERCQGKGWPAAESDEFTKIRDERLPALKQEILALAGQQQTGFCERAGLCVCGGDLPRIREGCSNWVKPPAA